MTAGETLEEEVERLRAENARLVAIVDDSTNYRDLELKMRDGTISLDATLGTGDGTPSPSVAMRWLGALMWNSILGEDNTEPPNYQTAVIELAPAGETQPLRACLEIVKPGGKTSHEIRVGLEQRVATLEARLAEATQ